MSEKFQTKNFKWQKFSLIRMIAANNVIDSSKPKFPPASIYLTIRPESLLPDQSNKIFNIDDIRSLFENKNYKQDENLKEVDHLCEGIKFLIQQLATLKTFSKTQVFDNNFEQQEKESYKSFIEILNKHNFDLENVSEIIIEDITTEFEK